MIDAQTIIRTVNRAEDAHFILTGMARTQTSGAAGPKVQTSNAPGVPLNLTMHDLAQDIGTILRELALDVADATGDWPDGLDASGAALFIRQRAAVVVGHEGRETTLRALEDNYRKATGVLGMLPRRTKVPEPCECGADQWVYHEDVAFVRCADGHLASLADHAYSGQAEFFTISQVARMTGMARSTIGYMIDRGDLHAEGRPPMVPKTALHTLRGRLAS